MMPIYHGASRRIEMHVKICILALLLQRGGRTKRRGTLVSDEQQPGKATVHRIQESAVRFFQINEA